MECRRNGVGGVSLLTQRRRRRKRTIGTSAAAMMMTVFLFRSLDLSQALTSCSFITFSPSSRAFPFFTVQGTQSDYGSIYVTDFNSNNIVALTSAVPRSIPSSGSIDLTQLESPLPETSISEATKQHNYVDKHTISNLLNHDIRMDDEEDDEKDASQPASGYLHMSESAKLFVSQVVHTANNKTSNNYHKSSLNSTKPKTTTTTTTTTTVRANVQETGNDALSSYLKNIANHDLLRHEDEIALGRQIQILVNYEQHRLLLEQTLLRYVHYNYIIYNYYFGF